MGGTLFEKMVKRMQTHEDVKTVLSAYCNYLGHRNVLKQTHTDEFLLKALEIGHPEAAFDMLKFHAELMVHPHNSVISQYLAYFVEKADYAKLKAFYDAIKGKFLLDRPADLNGTIIDKAFAANDKETVIAAYIDVLDYKRELPQRDSYVKVLESMDYSKYIDHVLFGHIKEQMTELGFECRIYQASYYINVNGGLTASDLLNSIAADSSVKMIDNSALFKREFVDKIVKRKPDQVLSFKGDTDVLEEM